MCQSVSACLKLIRPWLAIVYCYKSNRVPESASFCFSSQCVSHLDCQTTEVRSGQDRLYNVLFAVENSIEQKAYAWFPLGRNRIVESCDPSKFELTAQGFVGIYDKILLNCKSGPISVRCLLSSVINRSTISQNLLESHDPTILLRSNGNQALRYLHTFAPVTH